MGSPKIGTTSLSSGKKILHDTVHADIVERTPFEAPASEHTPFTMIALTKQTGFLRTTASPFNELDRRR